MDNDIDKELSESNEEPSSYTIDTSNLFSGPYSAHLYSSYPSGPQGYGGNLGNFGSNSYSIGASGTGGCGSLLNYNISNSNSSFKVSGPAEFDDDIIWKGRSIAALFANIEKRLAILQPNPSKLEKFEALRKAYEHYKTLEALCDLDDTDQK